MTSSMEAVKRPLWIVIPALVIGLVLISGIFALAAHHFFYAIILYSLLMALAGGMFGWLLADRFGFPGTIRAGVIGFAFSLGIYLLYRYFEFLLWQGGAEPGSPAMLMTVWDYTQLQAEAGMVFSRRPGSAGIGLGEILTWGVWGIEMLIAAGVGGYAAYKMDIDIETTTGDQRQSVNE